MGRAILATAAALGAFTALVLLHAMNGIDDWAIDHVMPGLDPSSPNISLVDPTGLWRPFSLDSAAWQKLVDTYMYPASVLVSGTLVAIVCIVLLRRGRWWGALVWAGAWCGVNAFEVIGKHRLTRPAVHWEGGGVRIHVLPFDNSYPSGHTARAVVVAAAVAYAWPRVRAAAAVWVVLVPAALVAAGDHTISDVVGGALLGLLAVLCARAMIRRWTPSQASSGGSSAGSSPTRSPSSRTSPATASRFPTTS